MMPWVPVLIRLAVALLPGGDNKLILSSNKLREQLKINVMDKLRVVAQG